MSGHQENLQKTCKVNTLFPLAERYLSAWLWGEPVLGPPSLPVRWAVVAAPSPPSCPFCGSGWSAASSWWCYPRSVCPSPGPVAWHYAPPPCSSCAEQKHIHQVQNIRTKHIHQVQNIRTKTHTSSPEYKNKTHTSGPEHKNKTHTVHQVRHIKGSQLKDTRNHRWKKGRNVRSQPMNIRVYSYQNA